MSFVKTNESFNVFGQVENKVEENVWNNLVLIVIVDFRGWNLVELTGPVLSHLYT